MVDLCARCPGVWLDAGELASLKPARAGVPLRRELPGIVSVSPGAERRLSSAAEKADNALEAVEAGVDVVVLVSDAIDVVLGALASLAD